MESPAPFDLNSAIRRWRDNLAQSPEYSGTDLDELESHLRDSIATLARNGMPMDAAFKSAQQRFGNPSQLAEEFAKAHPGRVLASRLMWLALGLVSIALAGQLASALGYCLDMLALVFAPEPIRSAVIIGSLALGYVVALFTYYHLITARLGFLDAVARWGIEHPLRFAGSIAAACFGGQTIVGLARAILMRLHTASAFGGAITGMRVVGFVF